MAADPSAPATKQDVAMIMEGMAEYYRKMQLSKDEMLEVNEKWKEEIIQAFHVVVEDIRHDAFGANKDRIEVLVDRSENHGKRITRLEKHAGLLAV